MKYSPTWITDKFPLDKLECQYFDICRDYIPNDCNYDSSCPIRQLLRKFLEDYVTMENINWQIELINESRRK